MNPDQVKAEKARVAKATKEERDNIIAIIDDLCEKEVEALTKPEKAYLKARKSYLTGDQTVKFKEVLEEKVRPKKPVEDLTKKTMKELQARAKELGYPTKNVSREDLEVAISTAEGPENAPKPE